jgi:hypothetical protein
VNPIGASERIPFALWLDRATKTFSDRLLISKSPNNRGDPAERIVDLGLGGCGTEAEAN